MKPSSTSSNCRPSTPIRCEYSISAPGSRPSARAGVGAKRPMRRQSPAIRCYAAISSAISPRNTNSSPSRLPRFAISLRQSSPIHRRLPVSSRSVAKEHPADAGRLPRKRPRSVEHQRDQRREPALGALQHPGIWLCRISRAIARQSISAPRRTRADREKHASAGLCAGIPR